MLSAASVAGANVAKGDVDAATFCIGALAKADNDKDDDEDSGIDEEAVMV